MCVYNVCVCVCVCVCAAGLGEFRIRDMNDEINKLLREKGHWEVRIKELGGPDYGVSILIINTQISFITLTRYDR